MSRIVFAADIHLEPGEPERNRAFLDFLEAKRKGLSTLYLLGDVFDYWIGPRHVKSVDYRGILETFRDLTSGGVKIGFIPGNRDYFVDRAFESATGVRILGDEATIDLDGRRVRLAHGDFIYNRNPKYAAYRRMMKFKPLQEMYRSMPAMISRGIARGFKKVSKKTTPTYRWSRRDIVGGARVLFDRGVEVLICGHIHAPQHVTLEHLGVRRDIFVLGDWDGGTREYVEHDGRGFRFERW